MASARLLPRLQVMKLVLAENSSPAFDHSWSIGESIDAIGIGFIEIAICVKISIDLAFAALLPEMYQPLSGS
jgi:hypothetical protein